MYGSLMIISHAINVMGNTNHSAVNTTSVTLTFSESTTSEDSGRTYSSTHRWMRPLSTLGALLGMFGLVFVVLMCSFCSTDKNLEDVVQEIVETTDRQTRDTAVIVMPECETKKQMKIFVCTDSSCK
ncbi:membrane protein UL124 [Saimiriine betaherpesvirus 4]|uniref:Membrane protein UL124 n=1 Tax=Saimiriine betaherpesvirus 4 TaxID=1535247 RepID=G8XT20_9BETA|nr:membrane protein UL124 [Saimiriine betaherpesvirus 4]AEV80966.1 membrane protein UL124 [Saimiriine betaherpesvirus 4]